MSADVPTAGMPNLSFTGRAAELFGTYFLGCHSEEVKKGDVDLSFMLTRDYFTRDYSTWLAVLEVLSKEAIGFCGACWAPRFHLLLPMRGVFRNRNHPVILPR